MVSQRTPRNQLHTQGPVIGFGFLSFGFLRCDLIYSRLASNSLCNRDDLELLKVS